MKKAVALVTCFNASLAHYGDPYHHGCEKDEIAATITGIPGAICIPPCNSDGSCPTDVPPNVTATPSCVLTGDSGKYCALVCTPPANDDQCGDNASCKKADTDGLCTYDDIPAPPSSDHWKGISSPSFMGVSEALAVAFTADGTTGYCGAGDNNVGALIIKTVDSGLTWTQVFPTGAKPDFNIFLAAGVKSATEAVVSGVLFQTYTTDGQTFNSSKDDFLDPAQDIAVTPGGTYGLPYVGNTCGMGTSEDGEVWKLFDMKANCTIYPPRYISMPSNDVWYISAGNFPTSSSPVKQRHVNHKLAIDLDTRTRLWKFGSQADPVPCSVDPTNCYSAGLFKTTNAGKSWTMVYSDLANNIYPNGINCFSEQHCIAAVEGDTCQILVTFDGGKTWTVANKDTDPSCSLTYVQMISDTEAWVGGGYLKSALNFKGRFWHTLDGGKTWTVEEIKGFYIVDIDMPAPTVGFAVGLTDNGAPGLLKYDPNPLVKVQFLK